MLIGEKGVEVAEVKVDGVKVAGVEVAGVEANRRRKVASRHNSNDGQEATSRRWI